MSRWATLPAAALALAAHAQPLPVPVDADAAGAGPARGSFEEAARLAVMITSTIGAQEFDGAGIVFAFNGDRALVLTANHVVRSYADVPPRAASRIQMHFRDRPAETFEARALRYESPPGEQDLAVLEVTGLGRLGEGALARLPFHLLQHSKPPRRGDYVVPMGYPKKYGWGAPVDPGRVDGVDGDNVYFQSAYVQHGHSGGPLFDADWRVIGLVRSVAQMPTIRALTIERARAQLAEWRFGIGEVPPWWDASAASASIAADTDAGRGAPLNDRWGGLSELYRYKTARLQVRQAESVPLEKDWLGNPDFAVEIVTAAGQKLLVRLAQLPAYSTPLPVEALDNAALRVVRERFLIPDTPVTLPGRLVLRQALDGLHVLRVPLTDAGRGLIRADPAQGELRLAVGASYFDPEGASGPDQDVNTPRRVPRGAVVHDSVSFDWADATDHLAIEAGESCAGLFWLFTRAGPVWVHSSRSSSGALLGDRISARLPDYGSGSFTGYRMACGEPRGLLRVQAGAPGSSAEYAMYISRDTPDPAAYDTLLALWVDRWRSYAEGTGPLLTRGVEDIVQVTRIPIEAEIARLEARLKSFNNTFPMYLVENRRERFEQALQECCKDAAGVRFVVELLRAEAGLPYDAGILSDGATQRFLPSGLVSRAVKLVGPAGTRPPPPRP